jgi:hypothetical protein
MNTGAGRLARRDGTAGQWVKFGWPGAPDILGQMPDGRVLALEVKRPSGRVRPEQAVFIGRVIGAGGLGAVVRSVDDVARVIA